VIKRDKKLENRIARERIEILLERAEKYKNKDYGLARRYVELAKKISMRYKVRIPEKYRYAFCKKCYYPYKSDKIRIRIRKSRVIVTCLNCGFERRIPIRPKRPE
jgi:ribonuclease P protein subunit RPR2